jgi:hypothetical protein
MSTDASRTPLWTWLRKHWPWLVLAVAVVPAVWHVVDFEEDIDPEFPGVVRPTFSTYPPSAYRLAEPGDTLDRIELYLSAAGAVLALWGLARARGSGLWPAALAVTIAALWSSATPGPTVDHWHGLGWAAIADPGAPAAFRAALFAFAALLGGIVFRSAFRLRDRLADVWNRAWERRSGALWMAALALALAAQFELPAVEPRGYWPRWAMIWALLSFDLGLVLEIVRSAGSRTTAWLGAVLAIPLWLGLVLLGIALTWYHRPLARLKEVVPQRIYISAMPTRRGLEVALSRQHFRTIINLFPEDTPQRSPLLGDELRFASEHRIRYVCSPSDPSPTASNAFLSKTLQLAQDPSAWPILVHCHGCMDRSPAWMGIYRFVVERRPLDEIMQEIERHRGYRPKASVTLLYNRVLPARAGARYWADPTAMLLRRCAAGTTDSMRGPTDDSVDQANLDADRRVDEARH